ncbi:MAG: phage minor head protein, partial [Candidatus Latescibacterota bacterium]
RRPDELTDGMQGAGASIAERLLARLGAPVRKLELSDVDGHDWDWYELYYQAVVAELQAAFEAAYVAAGPELPPTQAQTEAVRYARERGAQLLRLDGNLNLAETTRRGVRTFVAEAIEQGQSLGQIQRNLRDEFMFSRQRAELVARTESAEALGQGEKIAALAQGRDQKRWITQGDDRVEPECLGNQGAGWIGANERFPSGHDVIPAHPRCRCRTTFRHTPVSDVDPSEGLADDIAAGRDESRGLLAEARCPRCAKLLGKAKPKGLSLWCPRCKMEVELVEGARDD